MYFQKVSYEQWKKDLMAKSEEGSLTEEEIKSYYNNIKLPKRATKNSAGYDFFNPFGEDLSFSANSFVIIPSGIRWVTEKKDSDKVLFMFPKSGLGTKYGVSLRNTAGVIDADYCNSDNEGHIMIPLTTAEAFTLGKDKSILQGIILPFYTVDNEEEITTVRNGGFGSTEE